MTLNNPYGEAALDLEDVCNAVRDTTQRYTVQ